MIQTRFFASDFGVVGRRSVSGLRAGTWLRVHIWTSPLQGIFEVLEVISLGWFTSIFVFLIVTTAVDIFDGVCRDER